MYKLATKSLFSSLYFSLFHLQFQQHQIRIISLFNAQGKVLPRWAIQGQYGRVVCYNWSFIWFRSSQVPVAVYWLLIKWHDWNAAKITPISTCYFPSVSHMIYHHKNIVNPLTLSTIWNSLSTGSQLEWHFGHLFF